MKQIIDKLLINGEVEFSFTKKDGTVRNTIGTTSFELIPEEHQPKTKLTSEEIQESTTKPVIRYYDLDKCGWRSCSRESIIDIIRYKGIK